MQKKIILILFISSIRLASIAQTYTLPRINHFVDLSATFGESQAAIAASYVHNWRLGKSKKWEIGYGVRWTSFFGVKNDFTTAPARLARSTTFPFAIVFADHLSKNEDTLNVQRPFTNSINISTNFGYNFSSRWSAGFNIDLIGFTFGRTTSGILTSNGTTRTETAAKPAAFNVLLTGDNDIGSLNSEFFLKYKFNNRWGIKADYQFLFVEYKTTTIKQTAPDGTLVDRFRNKANTFGVGVSYHFNK
jgi:hypothetical protein